MDSTTVSRETVMQRLEKRSVGQLVCWPIHLQCDTTHSQTQVLKSAKILEQLAVCTLPFKVVLLSIVGAKEQW